MTIPAKPRSGRQNIAEGSRAAATSSQTELRLVNVARASLEELLLDYEDFLRHRRQPLWGKDDPRAKAVRRVAGDHQSDGSDFTDQQRAVLYAEWLEHDDPFVRAKPKKVPRVWVKRHKILLYLRY